MEGGVGADEELGEDAGLLFAVELDQLPDKVFGFSGHPSQPSTFELGRGRRGGEDVVDDVGADVVEGAKRFDGVGVAEVLKGVGREGTEDLFATVGGIAEGGEVEAGVGDGAGFLGFSQVRFAGPLLRGEGWC